MSKKKKLITFLCILFINLIVAFSMYQMIFSNAALTLRSASEKNTLIQLFYSKDKSFSEAESLKMEALQTGIVNTTNVTVSSDSQYIRVDFGDEKSEVVIEGLSVSKLNANVDLLDYITETTEKHNCEIVDNQSSVTVLTTGEDPYFIIDLKEPISSLMQNTLMIFWGLITAVLCVVADVLMWFGIVRNLKDISLIKEVKENRKLIWSLSKNDFKTKYSGSYFGIFWAFVQPIVTILIYVFVFQVGFKAAPEGDYPYVLWLIAGIIPWFFFVESLINATNCLLEYSYLVKKVVFKISVLPIVKIISSLFIHLFFIAFALLIYVLNGKIPQIQIIQIGYYCICMIALVLSISYFTASIVPFFKDFSQIVSILTQIGMWLIPIMWNKNMLAQQFHWILKLNPMYYVVDGYRDSFIYGIWFWEKPAQTLYFWGAVIVIYVVSMTVFKKLKVHFSDVL